MPNTLRPGFGLGNKFSVSDSLVNEMCG